MYICNECYSELLQYKDTWDDEIATTASIKRKIQDFMGTPPGTYNFIPPCDVDEEFKRLTGG
jgi:hypothetical protein